MRKIAYSRINLLTIRIYPTVQYLIKINRLYFREVKFDENSERAS